VYLDHAGTTLYSKALIERFSTDMLSSLYGNPHSAHSASQSTSKRIEDARLRLLDFCNADPDDFDVVFVANATAGMKLVMEAFRSQPDGFWYGYHRDSHTSLVGVRESAREHRCFASDQDVEDWIDETESDASTCSALELFAYPAQSNMNGRRLPLDWCRRVRSSKGSGTYTLLDAAALVSTSPLDLSNTDLSPDFVVMSLYKIFGFPDLGALIVRKSAGNLFQRRQYFGGGTVDMVTTLKEQWHERKTTSLHDSLEDGTLPVHNIMAVHHALDVHRDLFGSMKRISDHCAFLAERLFKGLNDLRHGNGKPICSIHKDSTVSYKDSHIQGPVIAFNILNRNGGWIPNGEIEKLATIRNICLRAGGLCNPGGVSSALQLEPWEMRRNFSAGQRCDGEVDILHGKPTGVLRVSLGAMSTKSDVDRFLDFIKQFYTEEDACTTPSPTLARDNHATQYYVESLTIYPIKSCAGWEIPHAKRWAIHREGLAWDREWCLVRPGSGTALNQKRYPRMALLRPTIDLDQGVLRVTYAGGSTNLPSICVPLSSDPTPFVESIISKPATVCGDSIAAQTYQSPAITEFFTQALGVACMLARFPADGSRLSQTRHSKVHLQPYQQENSRRIPGAFPDAVTDPPNLPRPILLSNESPILIISRSSLNRLNEEIKSYGGRAVQAAVFRANIVVAESDTIPPGTERPYVEDSWRTMQVGRQMLQILGSCRRCQMVCINQETGLRSEEPFVTLARTRRFDGRVFFGQHACLLSSDHSNTPDSQNPTIATGDLVRPYHSDDEQPLASM